MRKRYKATVKEWNRKDKIVKFCVDVLIRVTALGASDMNCCIFVRIVLILHSSMQGESCRDRHIEKA